MKIEKEKLLEIIRKKISSYKKVLSFMKENDLNLFRIILICNEKINYLEILLGVLSSEESSDKDSNISFSEMNKILE